MAQRLVRCLCTHCRVPHEPPLPIRQKAQSLRDQFPDIMDKEPKWFSAKGCRHCQHTGYRGRLGIYELAVVNDDLTEMILHQKPVHEMVESARKYGFRNLLEDGLIKAWQGETSVEETLRVAGQAGIDDA
jgi:general secretion pathway protein E